MRTTDSQQAGLEGASYKELRLLEEIQRTPEISQRQLARQLGVALGVANALVRRLARGGYIRATQVGWKRWVYVLTPSGAIRKLHLTMEYIESFLDHYRRVRFLLNENLHGLEAGSGAQVAIQGVSDLSELIYLSLLDLGLDNIEFIDEDATVSDFLGKPVKTLEAATPHQYSKVFVAFSQNLEVQRDALIAGGFSVDQIVTLFGSVNSSNGAPEVSGKQS